MVKCEICNQRFKNNLGGDLTKHIKEKHNISTADYYVLTILDGIEPICKCGFCNERPNFHRGKFSDYAIGHEKHIWQEKQYIKIYGQPKCQNPICSNNVNFYRGKPRKYCSRDCSKMTEPSHWNQEKVRNTVKEKYNVDNVFQLESVKNKTKKTMLKKYGVEYPNQSEEIKNKIVNTLIEKYNVDNVFQLESVKNKTKKTMLEKYGVTHFSRTKEFKEIASKNMCKYNNNVNYNHKIKHYKNTHIYYQSSYEYRFLEYCESQKILQYIDNSPTFKYPDKSYGKWHIPDFKFKDDFIVEIKSSYWLKRQGGLEVINIKKRSVEIEGYTYIFILDEDYTNFFNISK